MVAGDIMTAWRKRLAEKKKSRLAAARRIGGGASAERQSKSQQRRNIKAGWRENDVSRWLGDNTDGHHENSRLMTAAAA